jgi:ribose transport system substrate-binding protein
MVGITTQGSFFGHVDQGMQDVADIAGVDLQLIDGKLDAQVQADAVDNLITIGANAIIIDPLNADALTPVIARAVEAGIPVVAFDGTIEGSADISTFVGISNSDGGTQIGEALVDITGGKGEVGEITALNSTIQIERQEAFEEVVTAAGMTIGTVVDGQNQAEDAQTAAENLFTGSPDLTYVYATGQPALTGAVAAARSQNATDRVQIVGWDLAAESAQGIEDGFVKAVLQQDTFGMGHETAKAAITVACGGTVEDFIPVPTYVVTADNLDDYRYFLGE